MTKLLMILMILAMCHQYGIKFGGMGTDDYGHEYVGLKDCVINAQDGTTKGGFNGRCYVPIDGGTENDLRIWILDGQ